MTTSAPVAPVKPVSFTVDLVEQFKRYANVYADEHAQAVALILMDSAVFKGDRGEIAGKLYQEIRATQYDNVHLIREDMPETRGFLWKVIINGLFETIDLTTCPLLEVFWRPVTLSQKEQEALVTCAKNHLRPASEWHARKLIRTIERRPKIHDSFVLKCALRSLADATHMPEVSDWLPRGQQPGLVPPHTVM